MDAPQDLRRALEVVADVERPRVDPGDDLARARSAASSRRRRRLGTCLAGSAASAVLIAGMATTLDRERTESQATAPDTSADVELVAARLDAAPYTFDLTPRGWSVQAQQPSVVTIAPDGGQVSDDPNDFRGKLVIMFDANPSTGRAVDYGGRVFWVSGDSGYTQMATRTQGDEPAGTVRIQYPRGAGWDEASMLAFLASVHVGPGAEFGLG